MREINGKIDTNTRARAIMNRLKDEDGYIVQIGLIKKIMRYNDDTIIDALNDGFEVRTSLGTYDLAYKPPMDERTGRNLSTGEIVTYSVPERNAPRLRFSTPIKNSIREATEGNAFISTKDAKKLEE